jgi:hypothetical protein
LQNPQLAALQNQGFNRNTYMFTMPPFYKTNPIFYLILSNASWQGATFQLPDSLPAA